MKCFSIAKERRNLTQSNSISGAGRGTHVKRSGKPIILLSDINDGFWSQLGQTPLVLPAKVSFRIVLQERIKLTLSATLSSGIFKM